MHIWAPLGVVCDGQVCVVQGGGTQGAGVLCGNQGPSTLILPLIQSLLPWPKTFNFHLLLFDH